MSASMELKDITGVQEIEGLVTAFYSRVDTHPELAVYFKEVNWDVHLPKMVRFWDSILFYSGTYNGKPMEVHEQLNAVMPLKPEVFDAWIALFCEVVDAQFSGLNAEQLKNKAKSIATVMRLRVLHS